MKVAIMAIATAIPISYLAIWATWQSSNVSGWNSGLFFSGVSCACAFIFDVGAILALILAIKDRKG